MAHRNGIPVPLPPAAPPTSRPTAVIYCEANFGRIDGKTANGLVRSSERYRILAVIDSTAADADAGEVLDGVDRDIPIVSTLEEAIASAAHTVTDIAGPIARPDVFIMGLAPLNGLMSTSDREAVLAAISEGLDVVSGLHEYLADDAEISAAASRFGTELLDVRRPRPTKDLRMFDGAINSVDCIRIAVLGTDGAIGKRTTATILTAALVEAGIRAVMVGTGQTGLMQGAAFGVALDAIPAQFGVGELEGAIVEAWRAERPEVIVIEGQGALSHPAYLSSTVILRASRPQAVIMQHAPGRRWLTDYPEVAMPDPAEEIALIEMFGRTEVIGMTLNHERMNRHEIDAAILLYQAQLGIPVMDPLWSPAIDLVEMVTSAFPDLVLAELQTS